MWESYSWLKLTKWVNIYIPIWSWKLLGFTCVCTRWSWTHQQGDGFSHYQNLTSLLAHGSILEKFWGNRCWSMWESYSWLKLTKWVNIYILIWSWKLLGFTCICTWWSWMHQQGDGLSHYQNLTSLSAHGSILENFWGNQCWSMCESYSWLKLTKWMNIYIPIWNWKLLGFTCICTRWSWMHQQGDGLSHYQNSTSLSAHGSILENFGGTDVGRCASHTLSWRRQDYIRPHVELETLRAFMCMCMMVTDASARRWTLTLPKFDELFGPRFHFEKFLGNRHGWCEGRTLGWRRQDYIHPHVELETLVVLVVCTGMDNIVILFLLSDNDTQTKVQIDRTWLDSIFITI